MSKQANKFLAGLDAKQYRQVGQKVFSLLQDALPSDSATLAGAKHGERRVDVGEYRIIFAASDTEVDVLVIGKRNDDEVYRAWQRLV